MTTGICSTCKFGKLDYPPTLGSADDGVECSNPEMVELLDSEEAREEFADYGSFNLWRVEVVDLDCTCQAWHSR